MNIGIFGGTFDPVHLGHLTIAKEAYRRLNMLKVVFMPAGHPYFKADSLISPAEDRVNMIKLAITDISYFDISLLEIQRSGPSYAVESLSRIKESLGKDDELFFIMGLDSLLTLPHWQEPERLIRICKIVAAPRPGYPRLDFDSLDKELPGIARRTIVIDMPLLDISATDIRELVRQGLPIDNMVPELVENYIRERKLYRER